MVSCSKKPMGMSHMLQPMDKHVFPVHHSDAKKEFTVGGFWACFHEKHHLDVFGFGGFGNDGLIRDGHLFKMVMLKFIEIFWPVKIDPAFTIDIYRGYECGVGCGVDNGCTGLHLGYCLFLLKRFYFSI